MNKKQVQEKLTKEETITLTTKIIDFIYFLISLFKKGKK
jgi:hypothetical protein